MRTQSNRNSISIITGENARVQPLKTAWQFLMKLNKAREHQGFGIDEVKLATHIDKELICS